jgi:hypothetical protein
MGTIPAWWTQDLRLHPNCLRQTSCLFQRQQGFSFA